MLERKNEPNRIAAIALSLTAKVHSARFARSFLPKASVFAPKKKRGVGCFICVLGIVLRL
jgi:hypothetical protein